MTQNKKTYVFITIGMIALSMLMYEVLLTRICALRLFFHFGFLIVSNCLLGIGASGSMIAVFQKTFAKRERFWICLFSFLYLVSLLLTYMFLVLCEIDPILKINSVWSMLQFTQFNLISAIPFFFSGSVIGLLLTFNAEQINKVYCVDLLCAGLGCLLCPLFLWKYGAGGCFIFLTLLALAATVFSAPVAYRRVALFAGGCIAVLGLFALPNFDKWVPIPCKNDINYTAKRKIGVNKNWLYSRWSASSRVDVINDPGVRFLFGRGSKSKNEPPPEQMYIMQDGSAGTFIANFSENPEDLEMLKKTNYSLAFMLKENPRVFIIGVGGGNDVWAAKINGAKYIKGIELNKQILNLHRGPFYNYSRNIVDDPNIELVYAEGRSALARENSKYDVIQMTGIDTWTSLASGAYVLAENYLYTTEAIKSMYAHLSEGGILSITRMAREMEALRLISNISAALKEELPEEGIGNSIICLSSADILMTTLVKKGKFTADELEKTLRFAEEEGFLLTHHPLQQTGGIVSEFIRTEDKDLFIRNFPRNISPTPDDCPYFFNFTKWSELFVSKAEEKKRVFDPPSVSQGNPFFIFFQLLVSTFFAILFIVLPVLLFKQRGIDRIYIKRFLVYFMGLGLGFILIEVSIMQKLVLFLGHPLYSITVTLFAMLVFTGIGSLISEKWFSSPTPRVWLVPVGLAALIGLFILFSANMVESLIFLPKAARILLSVAILAPISLLLGVPFAYGIRLLNRFNPSIIPWAWAVNGCLTVIGSVLTVILSMNFGFNFVLVTAILIYFVSFFAVRGLK